MITQLVMNVIFASLATRAMPRKEHRTTVVLMEVVRKLVRAIHAVPSAPIALTDALALAK